MIFMCTHIHTHTHTQVAELQQHIDYLSSIECYADSVIEHPRFRV